MKPKVFFSLTLIAIILTSIFSPAVMAAAVYGPVQYEQGNGTPIEVNDSFSLNDTNGNYTLFLKNSDGEINRSSRASVVLNGKTVIVPEDFKQRIGMIQSLSLSPGDLKNVGLIQKNVSLEVENNLNVKMKSAPGSRMTLWIEDETSPIKIVSPYEDSVSNGTVNVSGFVDSSMTSGINLICNGVESPLPIENGNFSTEVNITGPTNITVSGTDSAGMTRSATVLLDGDMLMASEEIKLGFDPLNQDSDSSLTPQNEAGNGILDGMEKFEDQLPSYVKSRIGADPLVNDTDGDGLTDDFELTELGLLTDVRSGDSGGNGISDAQADPDKDGLTNIQEQANGTDPLSPDPDRDGLTDPQELAAGTNPRLEDTDSDGLPDGSEIRLGTNPNNPDSDGDGVPDGQEIYTSSTTNSTLGVTVAVTGTGEAAQNISIANVTSPCFTNISAVSGPIVDISLNESFNSANITIPYDSAKHSDYQNLGLFTYNETRGMFVRVPATVDPVAHTLTAMTSHFSIYTVFYIPAWNSLFSTPMDFGTPVPQNGPWQIIPPFNLASQSVTWFNGGSGFPAGPYKITAIGRYNLNSYVAPPYINLWETGAMRAWETYGLDGFQVVSGPASGPNVENPISYLTIDHYVGSASDPNRQAILRYTHPGGKIGLRVKEGSWTPNNNYGNLGYYLEYAGDNIMDHDGDGLNDTLETTGILTGFGKLYTNPNNPDTDGDGLPDGLEVGELMVDQSGLKYYKAFSDPTKTHSDEDGISDYDEYELGTNPLRADTDKDGINDNIDQNPLSYDNNRKPGMSDLEIGRAIVLGAVFGQSGIEGGVFEGYVDDEIASSPYYLLGWIGFGLVPAAGAVADARDAVQSFLDGDELGAALNAAGAFSGVGDGVKTGATITFFLGKYPSKLNEVRKVMIPLLKYVPLNLAKKLILDVLHSGAATKLLGLGLGVGVDDLIVLAERGVDLQKTLGVAKDGSNVRWLEEGTAKWGWIHIKRPERWQQIEDKFGPKTDEEVQSMIFDTIRSSDQVIATPGDEYKYVKRFLAKDGSMYEFSVIVSDRAQGIGKGNVVTVHPGV